MKRKREGPCCGHLRASRHVPLLTLATRSHPFFSMRRSDGRSFPLLADEESANTAYKATNGRSATKPYMRPKIPAWICWLCRLVRVLLAPWVRSRCDLANQGKGSRGRRSRGRVQKELLKEVFVLELQKPVLTCCIHNRLLKFVQINCIGASHRSSSSRSRVLIKE